MSRRLPYTLITLLLLAAAIGVMGWNGRLLGTLRALAASQLGPPKLPAGFSQAVIPFELTNQHVMFPVVVNNSRPLWFLLDTGDRFAVIDADRARELGLKLGVEIPVQGVGAQLATAAFVQDATFSIPSFAGFSQPLTLAIPLRGLSPRLGRDFDGILGADFIKQFVVELDYQARVIKLHPKDGFVYSGPGEAVPIRLDSQHHPIVAAEVTPVGGSAIQGNFVLDIGSGEPLVLYSPFVAAHQLPGPGVMTIKSFGATGTGGTNTSQYGRLASFKIGRFTFTDPVTMFSHDKAGNFAATATQGNIGAGLLRRFKVFFDYGGQRIILEPNSAFAPSVDRAFSGLRLQAEDNDYKTLRVKEVLEKSAASETGLKEDDIITAIDGQPVSGMTLGEVLNMFERPKSYVLTVRRLSHTLTLRLTPRKSV